MGGVEEAVGAFADLGSHLVRTAESAVEKSASQRKAERRVRP